MTFLYLRFPTLTFTAVDLSGRADRSAEAQGRASVRACRLLQAQDPLTAVLASLEGADSNVIRIEGHEVELSAQSAAVPLGAKDPHRLIESLGSRHRSCLAPTTPMRKEGIRKPMMAVILSPLVGEASEYPR
jgi:hypothetical protein